MYSQLVAFGLAFSNGQDLDGGASYYEGEFKLYLRSGHGTLENTEHLGLSGGWKLRFRSPLKASETGTGGVFCLSTFFSSKLRTGQKYVGEFLADKCHGKGKQVWPDAHLQ